MNKIDFSKIKLIIWDLDETFWRGTLSEGNVELINNNVELLKISIDCGVLNSICSKNNLKAANKILKDNDLLYYFVFTSINWKPKGNRIKNTIDSMHLRDSNVLFIDDNPSNREEAAYFCKNIISCDIDVIPSLLEHFKNSKKVDITHKRLDEYKVLEKKNRIELTYHNRYEFLLKSNIKVEIKKDCINKIDRIYELISRTNQLNFTKNRISKDALYSLLNDKTIESAYLQVNDKYGDYGISGFYAIKNNTLIHFLFSCRILGMGIEQYVYEKINSPSIKIIGEVSSSLTIPKVSWINLNNTKNKNKREKIKGKIVVHGPCDMELLFNYIRNNKKIIKELNYVNENGISINQINSTTHIVEYLKFSKEIRENETLKKLPFYDKDMYNTHIFDEDNEFVIISTFTDPDIARYKEKKTGIIVCFDMYFYDITDISYEKIIINKMIMRGHRFTKDELKFIRNNFEYLGRITPEEIVENFDFILNNISKNCKLIITLPGETECKTGECFLPMWTTKNKFYDDTPFHIYNKKMNTLIRHWAENKSNVILLDFNEFITGPESYTNKITHYQRDIYYKMCIKLLKIINNESKTKLRLSKPRSHNLKSILKKIINKTIFLFKRLYKKLIFKQ